MKDTGAIVRSAWEAGIGVPAFNVPHLPMARAIIRAVADEDSFALVEVARLEWEKFSSRSLEAVAEEFHRWADFDHVRLHLDHVPAVDEDDREVDYLPIISRAIDIGFQSVMIDGSRLPLARNIEVTLEVAEVTGEAGIPCEAELGVVLGHEEVPLPAYEELLRTGRGFTDPEEASQFVRETGCDWLSVAFGNVHGPVAMAFRDRKKVEARLDLVRLEALAEATGIPLVLHGGSGIRDEDVRRAFTRGVAKINVATEIRQVYEAALGRGENEEGAAEQVYRRVRSLIRETYRVSGSRGKV